MFDPLKLLKVTVISEAVEGGWGGGTDQRLEELLSSGGSRRSFPPLLCTSPL